MLSREAAQLLSDDEIAALTLAAYVNEKYPQQMRELFNKHNYSFSGDPNVNLYRLAELIGNRGSFFNDDYQEVLTGTAGMEAGRLKDVFNNIGNGIKNIVSTVANTAQQVLPLAAAAGSAYAASQGLIDPSTASTITNVVSNAFGPKPASSPSTNNQASQQTAIQQLANMTKDGTLMDTAKDQGDAPDDKDTILGMPKKTAYWVFGIGGGVIILVASILIYNHYKKNKKGKKKED